MVHSSSKYFLSGKCLRFGVRAAAVWIALSSSLNAQTTVTGWTLNASGARDDREDGITYRETTYAVTSFSTAANSYYLGSTASSVFIRRNTDSSGNGTPNQSGIDNNNRTSIWNIQPGNSTTTVLGSYETSLGRVLLNNNVVMGGDNLFTNSTNTATLSAGNIERVDFAWSGGVTAFNGDGLTVFDRGVAGQHDSVKIAVFTGWDSANNRPSSYSGNVVTVTAANYGANNLDWDPTTSGAQTNIDDYRLLRFANGDNLTALDHNDGGNNQGIAGAFISFASLGIASGTTIYGYSVMAADTTTTVGNLADWTNAAYYPTHTTDANGGVDLTSFNGRIARPVPEPAAYGAILAALGLIAYFGRNFRRAALN